MSNEIIYEDDTIIVCTEYNPASHIYDNDEINLNISNKIYDSSRSKKESGLE